MRGWTALLQPFADDLTIQIPVLFYAVPMDREPAPTTVFVDRFWDERERLRTSGVGLVTGSMRPYFGPLPPADLLPLVGTDAQWEFGLDSVTWRARGYVNPNPCWCLPLAWWRAGDAPERTVGVGVPQLPDRANQARVLTLTGAVFDQADDLTPRVDLQANAQGSGATLDNPPLHDFTVYATLEFFSQFGTPPGLAIGIATGNHYICYADRGKMSLGDRIGLIASYTHTAFGPEKHLYRWRRAGGNIDLTIDGTLVLGTADPRGLTVGALQLVTVGGPPTGPPPLPGPAFAAFRDVVVLNCAVSDAQDLQWRMLLFPPPAPTPEELDMPFVGQVVEFAGSAIPAKWLECDGSAVSRTTYADLYGVIGQLYGAGDGTTTFNLPDFRGRSARGVGTGSGFTPVVLAGKGGLEGAVLSVANLPPHNHALTDPGHAHTVSQTPHSHNIAPRSFVTLDRTGPTNAWVGTGVTNAIGDYPNTDAENANVSVVAAPTGISVGNTGSGTPVATLSPFLGVRKLIYAGA